MMAMKLQSPQHPNSAYNSVLKSQQKRRLSPIFKLPGVTIIQYPFSLVQQQLSVKGNHLTKKNFVQIDFFRKSKTRSPCRLQNFLKDKPQKLLSVPRQQQGEKCKTIRPKDNPYIISKFKTTPDKQTTLEDSLPIRRNQKKKLLFQNHNINIIKSRQNSIQITDSFENVLDKLDIANTQVLQCSKDSPSKKAKLDSLNSFEINFDYEQDITNLLLLRQFSNSSVDERYEKAKKDE